MVVKVILLFLCMILLNYVFFLQNNDNYKKSADTKIKLKRNNVSLRLIDGVSGEYIVRDEIKEKLLNLKNWWG
jgi:hypothetical protein